MDCVVFSTKPYDRRFFERANEALGHRLIFHEARLDADTAPLAAGRGAVCAFVNDALHAEVVHALADGGTRLVALRCAGFNHVDLDAAAERSLRVARVPAYSPYAVAEHTTALVLALNRKVHRAYNRVREGNFSLEGLMGFDMHGRTVGIVGTGRIGARVAHVMAGMGCRILACDLERSPEVEALGAEYVDFEVLCARADVITLHLPLTPETEHLVRAETIARMKEGVMLINTSRGALVDTRAVIEALKSRKLGAVGLDVYEEEAHVFFEDLSDRVIQDDVLARLLTFPNVIITSHQGFFTEDAVQNIAETTLRNLSDFEAGALDPAHEVRREAARG